MLTSPWCHDDEIHHLIVDRIVDVTSFSPGLRKKKDMTTVIGNARIVLADRVIERGWIAFADGRIAEYGEGDATSGGEDAAGDLIMPGLIELHTDHLEAHYVPRPKVFWDPIAAVVSYDGQLATSGITTVLDSLRVWREDGAEEVDGRAGVLAEAITSARDANLLRADHFLHLRCEIPMPSVVEEARELIGRPDVRLMSLLDHTPGQRQFRDEVKLRDYYRGKGGGMTDAELDILFSGVLPIRRPMPPPTCARSWRWRINTRSRSPAMTTPRMKTLPTRAGIAFRSRNSPPPWRPRAVCTGPASAS